VKEGWRPWLVDDQVKSNYYESCSADYRSYYVRLNAFIQVAGYVTKYDTNDFTFITVKGSGHMVGG
jgi:hypothetical protein